MGYLVSELDEGPAFKGNAQAALNIVASEFPEGPVKEVMERLSAAISVSEYVSAVREHIDSPRKAGEMSTNDGLGS